MSFLSRFFSKKKEAAPEIVISPECKSLTELRSLMDRLLSDERYIAKSEYKQQMLNYQKTVEYFGVLISSGTLDDYCKKNGMPSNLAKETVSQYTTFESLIDRHNDEFLSRALVSEKAYLDSILKSVDPKILLDDDQRKVVLSDEDYTLVIAGAGAGKTTTVAAKVKYLVEKRGVSPEQILVVSFTNKAVGELKDKLNKDLGINCPIATFHSTGNAILRKQNPEKLNIVDDSKLYFVIQDYFRNSVLKDEGMVNNLILFFASYFDAPYEGKDLNAFFNNIAKANYSTMRSDLNEFERQVVDTRTQKSVTIQSEVMRSYQEVEIANFLYLNTIDYEYEPLYRYDILLSRKPYTPDFIIRQSDKVAYIEHFGITQDGRNDRYSDDELATYKKAINDKIMLHRQHGTTLIYTFSSYNDGRPLLDHLKEELEANGFVLSPRSNKEVLEKLVTSEENRYIRKLVSLICRFITNFKTNGFTADEFSRMYHSTTNVRSRLFLDICNECYLEYDRYLKTKHDYKNVVLKGEWNEEPPQNTTNKKTCPICGYPLQFRYKNAYGLRLFMCTNEPEVCGFMTNEYKAGKLCIMKCDQCRDGYLIVKPAKNVGYFLGCTNYKADKTGCSNIIWKQQYYDMHGFAPDPVEPEKQEPLPKSTASATVGQNGNAGTSVSESHTGEVVKARLKDVVEYKGHDLNDAVYTVLSCLNHISISYFYGVTMLTDILRGAESDRITKFKLNKVKEYAAMSNWDREDVTAVIYWLIDNHYILRTKEQYPVMHPTHEEQNYSEHITVGQLKKLNLYLSE